MIVNIQTMTDEQLVQLYHEAKVAYYAGEPLISDQQFDAIEALIAVDNPDLISSNVGAPERGKKVKLPVQMGSLDQLHDQSELSRWDQKWPANAVRVLTEKLDGNSGLIEYTDGTLTASYSRGNGYEGANNLRHINKLTCVPKIVSATMKLYIRGEVIVSKSNWINFVQPLASNRAGKQYANSRNFIAGFLNSKSSDDQLYKYIDFIAYEVVGSNLSKTEQLTLLTELGFKVPKSVTTTVVAYTKYEELTRDIITMSEYELDGIVIDIDEGNYRFADSDELNPVYARKLKLINDANVAETTVTAVEWNISKDLMMKPLVHFDPVVLDGAVVSKATGHNARNIVDMGIGVGATIKVIRSGMVIPKIIECSNPGTVALPVNCKWNATQVELVSNSVGVGREVMIKRLDHFFTTLGVEYIGVGNITKMVDAGVLTTAVSAITCEDYLYERVIGENGRKCAESLRQKLQNVELAVILASFDVLGRGIGTRKVRSLLDGVGANTVLNATVTEADICRVEGFQQTTASKIVQSIGELAKLYKSIESYIKLSSVESTAEGFLSGQIVCPTGVRFSTELIDKIKSKGGIITDTLSSKVTILVAKDPNSTSSKIVKAREKGVKIISLGELEQEFGNQVEIE